MSHTLDLPPLMIDAGPQSTPEYSGQALRATVGGLLTTTSAGANVAKTGALDDRAMLVTISGQTVRAAAGPYAIGTQRGAYIAATTETADVGTITPADQTNARVDRVVLRIDDPDNGGNNERSGTIELLTGTPSANPQLPAVTGTSVYADLARIDVPRQGAGSPAVTDLRRTTVAAGGIPTIGSDSERSRLRGNSTRVIYRSDRRAIEFYDGSWKTLATADDSGWRNATLRSGFKGQNGRPPRFRKEGKRVTCDWGVAGDNVSTGDKVIGTVPRGFEPDDDAYITAVSNPNSGIHVGRFRIMPTGEIMLNTTNTSANYYLFSSGAGWYTR